MLVKPLALFGAVKAKINPGDMLDVAEPLPQTNTSAAATITLTGAQFCNGELILAGGTAQQVILPTADQLVKAVAGSLNKISPPDNALYGPFGNQSVDLQWPANALPLDPEASFRRIIFNTNSGTATFNAPSNAGVTITGTATAAAAKNLEFLIKILNSAPSVTLVGTTTNTSLVLSNFNKEEVAKVTPGMAAYGTGIGASAVVTAVNLDAGTITVSVASTATADNIAIAFTPRVIFRRLRLADN